MKEKLCIYRPIQVVEPPTPLLILRMDDRRLVNPTLFNTCRPRSPSSINGGFQIHSPNLLKACAARDSFHLRWTGSGRRRSLKSFHLLTIEKQTDQVSLKAHTFVLLLASWQVFSFSFFFFSDNFLKPLPSLVFSTVPSDDLFALFCYLLHFSREKLAFWSNT